MNKFLLIPMMILSLIPIFGLNVQGATYKTAPGNGKVHCFAKGKPDVLIKVEVPVTRKE